MTDKRSAARASELPTLRRRLTNFALAFVGTCLVLAIIVGWIYAVVVLHGAWRWVFVFGSMIGLFAWIISAPQEEGGW